MAAEAPEVTVVIPTRNRVGSLAQALHSVLGQVGVSLEVVVVDEASSDGTFSFLAGVSDARVRVVRHDVPLGPAAARNRGIELADGEWVGFLDDDDLWAPQKLRSQLDAVSAVPGCGWACVSAVHVDPGLRVLGGMQIADGEGILERLLVHNAIPGGGSGVIARTELLNEIRGFNEDLGAGEDWECWIRLAERSRLAVVDRPLLAYRMEVHSMSHDVERQQREEAKVRALHADLAHRTEAEDDPEQRERHYARQEMRSGKRLGPAGRLARLGLRSGSRGSLLLALAALVAPRQALGLSAVRARRRFGGTWIATAREWLAAYAQPRLAALAWTKAVGYDDIPRLVGGDARVFTSERLSSWPVAMRYLVAALRMTGYLIARRPEVVIVTNPPVFSALQAALYRKLTGAKLVLDSHPNAFGLRERRWALLTPLHRWVTPRSDAILVTTPALARQVDELGGRGVVMHEAPPDWSVSPPGKLRSPPRALVVTTFEVDDPVEEVLEAGRLLADLDFRVTGDTGRLDSEVMARVADSITFTGWLRWDDYRAELDAADVVICLTTDTESVMRAAAEAVYAECVLVSSDFPVARQYFPSAIFCTNEAAEIAAAVRHAVAEHEQLRGELDSPRLRQEQTWWSQLGALEEALDVRLGPSRAPGRGAAGS